MRPAPSVRTANQSALKHAQPDKALNRPVRSTTCSASSFDHVVGRRAGLTTMLWSGWGAMEVLTHPPPTKKTPTKPQLNRGLTSTLIKSAALLARALHNALKYSWMVHRHIGKHLTVEGTALLVEAVHQLAVGSAV